MSKVCLIVCTFAPDNEPDREKVIKRCLKSLADLKSRYADEIFIAVWDNNSKISFQNFLKTQSWVDQLLLNDQNFFDYGAIHALSHIARKRKIPYVIYCNDDIEFFDLESLKDSMELLEKCPDTGYMRLARFDFGALHIFDKDSPHPERDLAHCQRMYNWESKQAIEHERIEYKSPYRFYSTNMHWTLFPGLCKTDVFTAICPSKNYRPLQHLEGFMMKKYHKLGLNTIQLNKGVCQHLAAPDLSMRLKRPHYPVISWKKTKQILDAIEV